nr:integrase, catalytic region, zinc finger, CCHC-type, peptidase aspartic, catalytic [Tanacetum cinerariifolium]
MNKVKKIRFLEPLTSSSNIHKLVESSKTSDSNTPMLSSTGLKCSNSTCRSQPTGNKKNDRILQKPSSIRKNKIKAQPRKVNKNNRVKEPIFDVNVKHTMLNANSQLICVKCKQCTFDANHDVCFLDFVNDVNVRSKSKSDKKSQHIIFGNLRVVQIILWYLDFGCSKHMTWNLSQLMDFVMKFLGIVRFENDEIAKIMGYGDYQPGNVIVSRVYVKGLGHNLFSIG